MKIGAVALAVFLGAAPPSLQPHHLADVPIAQPDAGADAGTSLPPECLRPQPSSNSSAATAADWVTAFASVAAVLLSAASLIVEIRKR